MDSLFHTQAVYRVLLEVMSRPGTIQDLPKNISSCWSDGILAVAATLIDHEVGFCVYNDAKLTSQIKDMTQGRPVPLEKADFIFLPAGRSEGAIHGAKPGLPEFPDLGATIVYQAEQLTNAQQDRGICLTGPGIEQSINVSIQGVPKEELLYFTEINSQYPLGIDILLIDRDNRVMALPRSVRIREELLQVA